MIEKPAFNNGRSPEGKLNKEMFPPPETSSIDTDTVSKLQQFIDGNPALQEIIARDDTEIRARKQYWAEYLAGASLRLGPLVLRKNNFCSTKII